MLSVLTALLWLRSCTRCSARNQIVGANWHDRLLRDARSVTTDLFMLVCHRD